MLCPRSAGAVVRSSTDAQMRFIESENSVKFGRHERPLMSVPVQLPTVNRMLLHLQRC